MIGDISSNHGACYIKKTRAQVATARSIEDLACVVALCTIFEKKQWPFAAKMYHIYGKKISMHLSWYKKKHSLLIDLSKFSKVMRYYAFFSESRATN